MDVGKVQFVVVLLFLLLGGCGKQDEIVLQGYIEGEYTHLATSQSGRLTKLYVVRGQTVVQGQRIFDLDFEPEASEFKKAKSNLESEKSKLKDVSTGERTTILEGLIAQRDQAQADLELSKNNFNRTAILFQKGVLSRANYDEALAKLKSDQQRVKQFEQNLAEAQLGERKYRILQQNEIVRAAEASFEEAKWKLTQKSVVAPEAGLIYDTFFNEGEEISANEAVASLLAPRYVRLIFFIPEPWRAMAALNAEVTFTCDACQKSYHATINYISPQAEYTPPVIFSRESRFKLVYRVQARLPIEVAKQIYPGQPVDVHLNTHRKVQHFSWRAILWRN